jgi:dihydroorotate dehydrogenase
MQIRDFGAALARQLPAETAHNLTIAALEHGIGAPEAAPAPLPELAVTLPVSGLKLANPIGLAAGFDKNARAFPALLRLGFGFVECGTVTPRAQPGNPKPRLFRLKAERAVINRMGFNNEGLPPFVRRLAGRTRGAGVVGANIGANKDSEDRVGEYVTGMHVVWGQADYLTLNISSPNTPGLRGLQDRAALDDFLARCGEAACELTRAMGPCPVFLKVAPDLDDTAITQIASAARVSDFLTGLIVSNTTVSRPADLTSPARNEAGGLSGAPLMALSTRVLAAFAEETGGALDLIGAGGIATPEDVEAKLAAGAHAVQLYTALAYHGPSLIDRLRQGLAARRQAP